jgi:hypothetical protein
MTCASRLPALPIGIACAFGIPAIKQNAVAKALAAIQFFNMTLLHSLDLARSRHDGAAPCVKECRSQYEPGTNERFSMMNNMSSDRLPGAYITTGLSGSSFGPAPCLGKYVASCCETA